MGIRRVIHVVTMVAVTLAMVLTTAIPFASAKPHAGMSAEEYLRYRPNELGFVPVLMYHNIVAEDAYQDPRVDPFMYRTYDQFWNDMLWLYEHDFYLVGMNQVVSGNYDIPLGKHPIVFTFDDGSSLHFSAQLGDDGELIIDPNCAVGLMERFYEQYPDFGRGAHFGLVPWHKFSWPQFEEDDLFETKVQWLIDHNYEIGNHTLTHDDLTAIDLDEFARTISGPAIWADEFMGADHPMNATRVLTLPFGMYPTEEDQPERVDMLANGFDYDGYHMQLTGVLRLNGGSTRSMWSTNWNPFALPRIPVQDDVFDEFKSVVLEDPGRYYATDGDPETVTIPWPLSEGLTGTLNRDAIRDAGLDLVKYDPRDGRIYKPDRHHKMTRQPVSLDVRRYVHDC
ncbi:MAG: hypothetical protein M9909_12195 [Thermomicrobiales bacterium]|nr:hypothetical protein [Thermomicrobiales bacterium]